MCSSQAAPKRGQRGEELAGLFLELRGFTILRRNRRAAGGEIDIIARWGNELVFVEVRLRAAQAWVDAGRSIGAQKRERIRRCARALAKEDEFRWPRRSMRFDVVLIRLKGSSLQMEHLENVRL